MNIFAALTDSVDLQYGAFAVLALVIGLVALWVRQNMKSTDTRIISLETALAERDKVIARKDALLEEYSRTVLQALGGNTQALSRLTDTLRNRPCLYDSTLNDRPR